MNPIPSNPAQPALPFDPLTEARYRLAHLRHDGRVLAWGAAFGALSHLLLVRTDWVLLGPGRAFTGLLVLRLALVGFAGLTAWTALTTTRLRRYEWAAFGYMVAFVLALVPISLTRPADYIHNFAVELLVLLSTYAFLPDRAWMRILPALLATACSLGQLFFLKQGVPRVALGPLTLSFLLANVIGVYVTARLYRARREAWWREEAWWALAQRRKEFAELKSRFIREISHRFRNPLNVLSNSMELLGTRPGRLDDAQRAELLAGARGAVERLAVMLDELLQMDRDLAVEEASHPHATNLRTWLENRLDVWSREVAPEHVLALDLGRGTDLAEVDADLLGLVLSAALAEASDQAPPGSRILLQAGWRKATLSISLSYPSAGSHEDQPGSLGQVFDDAGTAPGLLLGGRPVGRVLAALGGTMETRPGPLTTLAFTFPLPTVPCPPRPGS